MFKSKSKYSTTKNDIKELPFAQLGRDCQAVHPDFTKTVEAFAETYGIKRTHFSWVYPQVIAAIGKWTPVKDTTGKVDGKATLAKALSGNDFNKGLYYFCMVNSRFLDRQYAAGRSEYCALVPLIMSAFKKMQGIPYNDWINTKWVMPENLYSAAHCDVPDYTLDELLQFRVRGMKAGQAPHNCYGVYHLSEPVPRDNNEELPGVCTLPNLARMMVLQTWCAHPQNRNKYMILNPEDWDDMPEPLVDSETPTALNLELPWDVEPDPKAKDPNLLPWE